MTNIYSEAIYKARYSGQIVATDGFAVYPVIDTTMRVVDEAITNGDKPEGYTAIALRQTAGIGSTDPNTGEVRKWWSEAAEDMTRSNVLFSRIVTLRTDEHQQDIQMIASLATGEVLRTMLAERNVDAEISWRYHNDVLLNGLKVADHLARPHKTQPDKINLGVGVNIALTPPQAAMRADAPTKYATSLPDVGVHDIGVGDFIARFDERFDHHLAQYRNTKDFTPILIGMNLAEAGTGLMHITPDDGDEIRGTFMRFETAPFDNAFADGTSSRYTLLVMRDAATGAPHKITLCDLNIVPPSRPNRVAVRLSDAPRTI